MKAKATPFCDETGFIIYDGDLCRTWIVDECDEKNGGMWVYEKVKKYKGDWRLFDIHFDYDNSIDEPVLLEDYHNRIEIVDNLKFP